MFSAVYSGYYKLGSIQLNNLFLHTSYTSTNSHYLNITSHILKVSHTTKFVPPPQQKKVFWSL